MKNGGLVVSGLRAERCGGVISIPHDVPLDISDSSAIDCGTFIDRRGGAGLHCPELPSSERIGTPENTANTGVPNSQVGYGRTYEQGYNGIKWKSLGEVAPMKIVNNTVERTDTFYRGPDGENTLFDGNTFKDGRIFIDIIPGTPAGTSIVAPDGMTPRDLKELALALARAQADGRDPSKEAEKSPWWPKLLAHGANGATLLTALVQGGAALLG